MTNSIGSVNLHTVGTKRCEGRCNCGVEIRVVRGRPAWDALSSQSREKLDWDDTEPCPVEAIEQDEESCWWRCATCGLIGPYMFHQHRRKKDTTDV